MLSVYPSGSARTTREMPMVPPAPVTFSTMTGWPSAAFMRSPSRRAMVSGGPPAVVGTTIVMGRLG